MPLLLKNSQKHRLMVTTYYDYGIQLLLFCQYQPGLDDNTNRHSMGPFFKICVVNCLIFPFFDQLVIWSIFSVYICVWYYLLQSNCNNGHLSRKSFVNILKVNIFFIFFYYQQPINGKIVRFYLIFYSEGIAISKLVSQLKLLPRLSELEDNDTIVVMTIRKDCKVFFTFTSQQMPKVTVSFLL